jgi:hypothetical protein
MPKSVSWDPSALEQAAAEHAAVAGVVPGSSSGNLPSCDEPSIYLEQTMSTANTGQDWRGVLQLQELSFDSMMPGEGLGGDWQQRTTMQQLLAAHQGNAAAAAAAGQCPFGHGRAPAAAVDNGGGGVSLNGVGNHRQQ